MAKRTGRLLGGD